MLAGLQYCAKLEVFAKSASLISKSIMGQHNVNYRQADVKKLQGSKRKDTLTPHPTKKQFT